MKNYKNNSECIDIDEKKVAWKVLKIIGMVILGIAVAVLFGFVVMWLWNWLMPMIFGLTKLTYWQAVGILILAKIIFGGFGMNDSDGHKKSEKGTIRHEIKKEIKKEFDKEFDKDHPKEKKEHDDYDEMYESWWKTQGEKNFGEYMKNLNKDDEE
jgi:hypothetical protein